MNLAALVTSAGINIGICTLLLLLYSILRNQPGNAGVYFGRRLAEERSRRQDLSSLKRLIPSPSWIVKAWESSEDDILATAGLDAAVFIRIIVFSMRIFSIATAVCVLGVLPSNYFGREMQNTNFHSQSLEIFTIGNVKKGSKWLWVHCISLYIISFSACTLLYFEYKSIARLRFLHISQLSSNPRLFAVLVRAIPKSDGETISDSVKNFFTKYHAASYLSHQLIFRVGKVHRMMDNAEKAYKQLANLKGASFDKNYQPFSYKCGLCGGIPPSKLNVNTFELGGEETDRSQLCSLKPDKECAAAFVFFRTRYAALVASQVRQSSNPMQWVTDLAPDPDDVYWSNLWIPYRQLWFRRIATLAATVVLMFLFLIPITFVQGLSQLDQLRMTFPFLNGLWKKELVTQIVTGYLPSVILQLFLYTVPPMMLLFSAVEGSTCHSERKKSACCKVLCFSIWNVFFVNVLSGSAISQLHAISSPKDIPSQLAKAVPRQATFFITYVLTSGWAGLSWEAVQIFRLIWNLMRRKDDPESVRSFPYHTEIPKVMLIGLLGLSCSIQAPLIAPFALLYFLLAFVVYRNQMLNVYCSKNESGGGMWPVMHNASIFSLVLSQIGALGVFGTKDSPFAFGFTIPLLICTLLFNEYCRQRFRPLFDRLSAQEIIDMDAEDQRRGRMDRLRPVIQFAYRQIPPQPASSSSSMDVKRPAAPAGLQRAVRSVARLFRPQP